MGQSPALKFFNRIFQMFSSLKLAVLVILSLAISLGAATFVESLYDTQTAQYWIYRAAWFQGILALLGINIFCVAMSRYPWKQKHIPFLLAHAGILILLLGSYLTEQMGVDGNLRVTEGETASVVELDTAALVMSEKESLRAIPIRWIPPEVKFKPFSVSSYGLPYDLKVDQYLSHADPVVSFVPNTEAASERSKSKPPTPAVKFLMTGGPMGISQEIWLWTGAPAWKVLNAGPARFSLGEDEGGRSDQPRLRLRPEKDGSLSYVALSSAGKRVQGRFEKNKIVGQKIMPGWKGNVTLTMSEWVPDAVASTTYKPARIQYGMQAPTSAIHVVAAQGVDVWMGLGDRAVLHLDNREVEIGYFPKRFVLPFSIRLERFTIEHNQGTLTPASYSSRVSVLDGTGQKDVDISMNEPLHLAGYTVYQASYEEGEPRPVTSVFAVNRDPGRSWKYLGSALIVLGSILLFGSKYSRKKTAKGSNA